MAVGKSTIAPLLAKSLGIAEYMGQGFHGLDNQPLTKRQLVADRFLSVLRKPGLFARAIRMHHASVKERIAFALNLCRRDRFVALAARSASGVVASGPVHAIAQLGAWIEQDLTDLGTHVTRADVYVRLGADPVEVARRLASRDETFPREFVDRHGDWIERYDRAVTKMLTTIERPVVEASTDESPDRDVLDIVTRLGHLTDVGPG